MYTIFCDIPRFFRIGIRCVCPVRKVGDGGCCCFGVGATEVPPGRLTYTQDHRAYVKHPPRRPSRPQPLQQHPPFRAPPSPPRPTSPLLRCSATAATAAPPARSQMAGRAAGAPRAGTGCANLPPPIAIAFPARGGRPVGRGGGSAARVSSGLQPPAGAPPPRAPSLHRRPELLTGARWPQVPAAGRRRLGASTSPSRGPRHALGSSRLVTLSANLPPDFSCSHQPSPWPSPPMFWHCWRVLAGVYPPVVCG